MAETLQPGADDEYERRVFDAVVSSINSDETDAGAPEVQALNQPFLSEGLTESVFGRRKLKFVVFDALSSLDDPQNAMGHHYKRN